MKVEKSHSFQDLRQIPYKNRQSLRALTSLPTHMASLCNYSSQRREIIALLYRAHNVLDLNRSTLYLAIGLLDKLIRNGLMLTDSNS